MKVTKMYTAGVVTLVGSTTGLLATAPGSHPHTAALGTLAAVATGSALHIAVHGTQRATDLARRLRRRFHKIVDLTNDTTGAAGADIA